MKKRVCKECGHTMTQHRKFKEIYDKFGGSYGELIEEHLRGCLMS